MRTPAATPRARRTRPAAATLALALLAPAVVTGCAAGIQAETSRERPTINSVGGAVGDITLRNVYVGGPGERGGSIPVLFGAFNGGNEPDQLTGVSSPIAAQAAAPDKLDVVPGQGQIYNPGGSTPRLTGLSDAVRVGQQVQLTLTFQRAGSITLEVPVDAVPEADLSASPSPSASPSASAKPSASPLAKPPASPPAAP